MKLSTLVSSALKVDERRVESIAPVAIETINNSYCCTVAGFSRPLYLKLQGGQYPSFTVAHEATVLDALQGQLALVPRLLAHGSAEDGRVFLITEGLAGSPLSTYSNNHPVLWEQVLDWLQSFQTAVRARGLLALQARHFIASYAPDFIPCPAVKFLSEELGLESGFQREITATIRRAESALPDSDIVHGSLTPYNLLGAGVRLTGVIDFEAARLGDSMSDVATLAFYYLLLHKTAFAHAWLTAAADRYGRSRIAQSAIPFLLYAYLMRVHCHSSDSTIDLPAGTDLRDILQHFGE